MMLCDGVYVVVCVDYEIGGDCCVVVEVNDGMIVCVGIDSCCVVVEVDFDVVCGEVLGQYGLQVVLQD